MINGNNIDLNSYPSILNVVKKPIPLRVKFADSEQIIQTLEGPVTAPIGSAIITGTKGEQWPIPLDKFNETYEPIFYAKKNIPVLAIQMTEPFEVKVSWSDDKLTGKVGDYLVQYGEGDYGIAAKDIFNETYANLNE